MTADYFAVFSLPRAFDIDIPDLEKSYFAAQRRFHPDRLIGKNPAERQQAIVQSMLVNEAYEILKSPLQRARHLLMLAGVNPDSLKPSHELLMEIMELREALTEADSASKLQDIRLKNETEIASVFAELTESFAIPDMQEAAGLTMRLSYLLKLEDEIRIRNKILEA
jgi:molecular chaperone HscB